MTRTRRNTDGCTIATRRLRFGLGAGRCGHRSAFTLIELMASMGILVVVIVAVASIFNISSDTAGKTAAHSELLEGSAALRERLTRELGEIVPGCLIIESPPPTLARAETPGGRKLFRLRHDLLVFITSGGEYQSFTDPTRGTPTSPTFAPASSASALIYVGPGIPIDAAGGTRPFDDNAIALSASEWMFVHRAILLTGVPPLPSWPAGWTPPDMDAIANGAALDVPTLQTPALSGLRDGGMDAIAASPTRVADPTTFVGLLMNVTPANLFTDPSTIRGLWEPSLVPITASMANSAAADYYTRSGSNFQPRLADFRIEWTDGKRVDPNAVNPDWSTRWFGLRPDPTSPVDLTNPDSMKYLAVRRQDFTGDTTVEEQAAYRTDSPAAQNGIEWSPTGVTSDVNARYRAVWRADTWQFRPKALRFTYRIFDGRARLSAAGKVDLNENGIPEPEGSTPTQVTRYGQEFSIVVGLP